MPPEAVDLYLDQDAVAAWLPLGSMNGGVHAFDGCEAAARRRVAERPGTFRGPAS